MKKPASPCKGCENREVGCQGKCKGYAEWKARYTEYKRWIQEQRNPEIKLYIIEKRYRGKE